MADTGRSQAQERRLLESMLQLTNIMTQIRNCPDIDCLDREIAKLVTLADNNKDLWNYREEYPDDYMVIGLRRSIFSIPSIIEANQNFSFDFARPTISAQYRRIRKGIENIFDLLHMDIEISIEMETHHDSILAEQLDREINSLVYQQQEEEQRRLEIEQQLEEQRQREARIDAQLEKVRRELEQVRLREKAEIEKSLRSYEERKKEEEEEYEEEETDRLELSGGFSETEEEYWSGEE